MTLSTRSHRRSLLTLNALGGVAVLGSYAYAFSYAEEIRAGLWGGVPPSLQPLYVANMFLAAAGYFCFSFLLVLRTSPDEFRTATGRSARRLFDFYALVLFPSAAWLPLTARMIEEPSAGLWALIRIVLLCVAFGSAGILWASLAIARRRRDRASWLAVAGALPFFVQTALLDAIVWPLHFPR